jgi:methionine synthase I (cobalamin-dependent)
MACPASGLDCCYVGEEEPVFSAMKRLEEAMDQLDQQNPENEDGNTHESGTFLNELVMQEVLGEVKEIAARGGISCQCGSKQWRMRIHYSSLELVCPSCGGSLRIPAATQSDLTDLCCKDHLLIHAD